VAVAGGANGPFLKYEKKLMVVTFKENPSTNLGVSGARDII
jgi:hypothetical protein